MCGRELKTAVLLMIYEDNNKDFSEPLGTFYFFPNTPISPFLPSLCLLPYSVLLKWLLSYARKDKTQPDA